jgi:hypothetical protein
MSNGNGHAETQRDIQAGLYFMAITHRRICHNLAALWENDDDATSKAADAFLK